MDYHSLVDPLFMLEAPELRRLLDQLLRTDSEFDAFVLDYFPKVKQRYSSGMDRVAKVNLLLETVERTTLCTKIRVAFPRAGFYVLTIERGGNIEGRYPLPSEGHVVIGRAPDSDIQILDSLISRRHAVLEIFPSGEVFLTQQGKYPVSVNDKETARRVQLWRGDLLRIRETTFRLLGFSPDSAEGDGPKPVLPFALAPTDEPPGYQDPQLGTPEPETERLLWGLSNRLLTMSRLDEAERLMTPHLKEVRQRASAGEVLDPQWIASLLHRVLKLASATRKDVWFGWIFDVARLCAHRMTPPFLDELHAQLSLCRPAVGEAIAAYARTSQDAELTVRLTTLAQLCR